MLDTLSPQRYFVWLLVCLTACGPCTSVSAEVPKTIGHLDSKDVLVFKGNHTFTKEQICTPVYSDKDVILAISPAAPLADYLKTLESKIRLGYLHAGFFSPTVQAAYVAEPEKIVITIEEGPRYTKGQPVIEGASDALKDRLIQSFSEIAVKEEGAMDLSEFCDGKPNLVTKPLTQKDLTAFEENLKQGLQKTFLGPFGRPSFAPSAPQTSKEYLDYLLKVLGYYRCQFTVKMVPDHPKQTASVHIVFQNEGVRARIGTIDIVGNNINSDEQILTFLELKTGQPLNEMLAQTLRTKLTRSGRFRLVTVTPEINTDDPAESTLHIAVEEIDAATALDGKLTEKEELMQKVGQFMDRHQSWEQDVRIRFDSEQAGKDLGESVIQKFKEKTGMPIPDIEIIYSPQQGIILTELINGTQVQNAFVIGPEQIRYICPPLKQDILSEASEVGLIAMFSIAPSQPSLEDKRKWHLKMGMGMDTGSVHYSTQIDIHPGAWFYMANDPEGTITMIDEKRAQIQSENIEVDLDRQNGQIIKIQSDFVTATFEKDLFSSRLEQLEKSSRQAGRDSMDLSSSGNAILGSILPLYLTHTTNDTMNTARKIQAAQTLQQFLSGFADCRDDTDDTSDQPDSFSLPMDKQLASGGMMPMLMGFFYQSCHDSVPRDSWIRTLSHAAFLMSSGYAQHPSVGQDLQQIYTSDQIGPIGYLITAQFLGQLRYPASNAFAQRGLQVLDADHFRKDWQPLLVKESELKTDLLCYLEQFQAGSDEGVRLIASFLPEQYAALVTAISEKLRSIQTEQLHESLDPILTDFWETTLQEQIRQQLNQLLGYKTVPSSEQPASAASEQELRELEKKAEAGDPNALVQRGVKYLESGTEDPFRYKDAKACFEKAAEQNDADGQYYLGRIYYYGVGVVQDFKQALEWYTKASKQNHGQATYELSVMYARGEGVEPDEQKSIELCTRSAELGFAFAQNNLSQRYYTGDGGFEQDYAKSIKWLRKAAEQGFAEAQYNLGTLYMEGTIAEKDYAKAAQWYQKAGEQGYPMAMYNMGQLYLYGWGVKQDYTEAVKWWRKAAEAKVAAAQFCLGKAYENGDGVEQDYRESIKWYTMAALQQCPGAWNQLGMIYEYGWGVEPDYAKALEYYLKETIWNAGHAETNLARIHLQGKGTKVDLVQAYKWAILAGVHGQYNEGLLKSLEASMTPSQMNEGRRLANEYTEKNKHKVKHNPAIITP